MRVSLKISLMVESFRLSPVIKWLFIGTFQKVRDFLETFFQFIINNKTLFYLKLKYIVNGKFVIFSKNVIIVLQLFFQIELWIHFFNTLF